MSRKDSEFDEHFEFDEPFENSYTSKIIEPDAILGMSRRNFLKFVPFVAAGTLAIVPIGGNVSSYDILRKVREEELACLKEKYEDERKAREELDAVNARVNAKHSAKRLEDTLSKAWYVFPESRPYLEMIADSNSKYREIYDIPVEYHIGLMRQESLYLERVISFAGALGLGQLMRGTAKQYYMKVFDKNKFPKAFECEEILRKEYYKLNTVNKSIKLSTDRMSRNSMLKKQLFDEAEKLYDLKLTKEQIWSVLNRTYEKAKNEYKQLDVSDDDRINPKLAIDFSAKHLATLARQAQKKYGGRKQHNILRSFAAYNSGPGNAFSDKNKGLPPIPETMGYVRNIMFNADLLYPGYE